MSAFDPCDIGDPQTYFVGLASEVFQLSGLDSYMPHSDAGVLMRRRGVFDTYGRRGSVAGGGTGAAASDVPDRRGEEHRWG
jgi:hypothetical protein